MRSPITSITSITKGAKMWCGLYVNFESGSWFKRAMLDADSLILRSDHVPDGFELVTIFPSGDDATQYIAPLDFERLSELGVILAIRTAHERHVKGNTA